MARSFAPGLLIALAVLAAALLFSFTVGRYPAGVGDLFDLIAAKFGGRAPNIAPTAVDVRLHVRGPRVLAAVLVGAALSVAGTAIQGLFRNLPLVPTRPCSARIRHQTNACAISVYRRSDRIGQQWRRRAKIAPFWALVFAPRLRRDCKTCLFATRICWLARDVS